MIHALQGWAHANLLASPLGRVDIPKPGAPDSNDIKNKGDDAGDWLANRSGTFWMLVVVAVAALIIMSLLKRPFVRGLAIGAIILIVALVAFA